MKKLLKATILTLLLAVMVMAFPGRANAEISKDEEPVYNPGNNIITKVTYAENTDGSIKVTAYFNWASVKPYTDFTIYIADSSGKIISTEAAKSGTDFTIGDSSTPITYSVKYKFKASTKYYIAGYADSKGLSDSAIAKDLVDITTPDIVINPYKNIDTISMSEDYKEYSGTIYAAAGGKDRYYIYKLDATADAVIELADFTYSTQDVELILLKMNSAPASSSDITNKDNIVYTANYNNKKMLEKYPINKGTYYIAMHGPDKSTYKLKLKVRKYRHAQVKWSIKEGPLDSTFKQNQDLHVTFEITNKDSDAYLSPAYSWSAQGHNENSTITVSDNGKKGEFIVVTKSFPYVSTVKVTVCELNPNPQEGKVSDTTCYTLDITTGMAMTEIAIQSGPDYIEFPDFRSPQFSQDGSTKINVYLKSGSKWKKKFTVDAGSRTPKKIKKLKPKKKYQVKVELVKTIKDGKQVKTSKVYKVKTGPKITPAIKSAKIDKVWNDKVWVPGHFNSSGRWEKGYYSNNKYYTMTITLKKKLKGCKGIYVNGKSVKGTGTTFTVTVAHSDPPSKVTVKGYTDNKFYGFTKASKATKVSR
ncbi:MAG: hypothetical protein J5517_06115 [Eubacterium sp.]|nr:hypothetical protein [Eubacterium sp.]